MPEIKTTTTDQAIALAIDRIQGACDVAKSGLDHQVARAIEDLKTRDAAIADMNGLLARAQHVFVKDHTTNIGAPCVQLGHTAIRLPTGQELRFVDEPHWSPEPPPGTPRLEPGKRYRFWLLVEEVGHGG